jgi:folate-binding protein YgfZ
MTVLAQQEKQASGLNPSRRELTGLIAACGVRLASEALFSITGRDRVRWLNGMVTNNIRDLAVGHGVYAFVLNAQGHILGDLYVFNRGESLVAEIEHEQVETLLPIFRRYIIMDKVEFEDLTGKTAVIGLTGPKSPDVLVTAGLRAELAALQFSDLEWKDFTVTVVRGDNCSSPTYQLWVPAEKKDLVYDLLRQTGAEAVSEESLESFRILCGIPQMGKDIRERTLPQETGQDRALSFTKGCYIGQEIVERIRTRGAVHRAFIGFEVEGTVPPPGTKIQSEGRDVGELTTIAGMPLQGKRLALGFLRKEFAAGDKVLAAQEAKLHPVRLPFRGIFD